ncbi:hypothetical protein [Pseudohoeflea coraliihabitans]|uniref:DUF202 domain-containing protein n=1 Tax=Pseudohoeflea coraliihabitans TaxID=2860393 RepID=A0ABS6WJG3_9HYPH|nr:hypothetical protein [Pseudohoeflea sp. DP4N28-3]MBW3095900.1 hypothetical protein [Pseudohoeflea sp. DP4N28-3]
MQHRPRPTVTLAWRRMAIAVFGLSGLALLSAFTFAGWSAHGAAILSTVMQTGLSWCL